MKKCPVCSRVYSDAVDLCPLCEAELCADSGRPAVPPEGIERESMEQTSDHKGGETKVSKVKKGDPWKIAAGVFFLMSLLFVTLYVKSVSDYNDLEREYDWLVDEYSTLAEEHRQLKMAASDGDEEYQRLSEKYAQLQEELSRSQADYETLNKKYQDVQETLSQSQADYESLNEKYQDLEDLVSRHDLEGKYTIDVYACYSGDDEYTKISDNLAADELDCICLKWYIYDDSGKWSDVYYADVITPDGEVFMPKSQNSGHTWMIDPSDTSGTTHSRQGWFRMSTWKAGTYRVVYYQGEHAIDSYEFKVSAS